MKDDKIEQNKTANQWRVQGNQSFQKNQYSQAIYAYSQALKLNPENHLFHSNCALCHFRLQDFESCIKDCNQCLKINPKFGKALTRRGMAQLQLLKFDEAIISFKQAYENQKDQGTISQLLKTAQKCSTYFDKYLKCKEKQDYELALKYITLLSQKIQNNIQLKFYQVQCLAKCGALIDASKLLQNIAIANAQDPDFCYLKGIICLYDGDYSQGQEYLGKGSKIDLNDSRCQSMLNRFRKCLKLVEQADQLLILDQHKQAEQKYTEALGLDQANKKMNSDIYSKRAQIWIKSKRNLKALNDLNKSLKLNPSQIKSLMGRAELNMKRRDYEAALQDYTKIQSLDPQANMIYKIEQAKTKQKKEKDYYKILEISRNATPQEIKKAYKKTALKFYHPKKKTQEDQIKYKQVAEAYNVLSDPEKRQKYDSGQIEPEKQGSWSFGNFEKLDVFQKFFKDSKMSTDFFKESNNQGDFKFG